MLKQNEKNINTSTGLWVKSDVIYAEFKNKNINSISGVQNVT